MIKMGSRLKRLEKISGRLGDILSCLYMISAVLKRYHDDGEPDDCLPLVDWSCQQLFHECEEAILGIINNFPGRVARGLLSFILRPLGNLRNKPSDKLGHKLAQILIKPNAAHQAYALGI